MAIASSEVTRKREGPLANLNPLAKKSALVGTWVKKTGNATAIGIALRGSWPGRSYDARWIVLKWERLNQFVNRIVLFHTQQDV